MVRRALLRRRPRRLTPITASAHRRVRFGGRGGLLCAALAAAALLLGLTACSAEPDAPATPTADAAPALGAVRALLDVRAAAVRDGDAAGVAATEVAGAVSPVRERATVLPVAVWRYDAITVPAVDSLGLREVRARLTYRLDPDTADVVRSVRLSLRADGDAWLVASERVDGDRPELWELGGVSVVVRGGATVVAVAGADVSAARVAATAARAVEHIGRVWTEPWPRSAVVVLVPTGAMLARGLGRDPSSLRGVGAVTAAAGDAAGEQAVRIWVATEVLDPLNDLERLVLLRHETVHVASGSVAAPGVPQWLIEGMAEQLGYADSVPLAVAAGAFLDGVARRGAPSSLPSSGDLAGGDLLAAYGGAHVAADLVVGAQGTEGLVRLYLLVRGDDGPAVDIDTALREVTGLGLAAFTAAWRARAAELARASR